MSWAQNKRMIMNARGFSDKTPPNLIFIIPLKTESGSKLSIAGTENRQWRKWIWHWRRWKCWWEWKWTRNHKEKLNRTHLLPLSLSWMISIAIVLCPLRRCGFCAFSVSVGNFFLMGSSNFKLCSMCYLSHLVVVRFRKQICHWFW